MRGRQRLQSCAERLFGYAVRLTNDREKALELVQDCSVQALFAGHEPEDEAAYRAWLITILRNAFLDSSRRKRPPPAGFDDVGADGGSARRRVDRSGTQGIAVRNAFGRLRQEQREIIALIDMMRLTYAEAARHLDTSETSIMRRISDARSTLLNLVADDNVIPLPVGFRRKR